MHSALTLNAADPYFYPRVFLSLLLCISSYLRLCLFNSVYLWPSFSKRTSKTSLRLHLATSVSLLQNIFHLVPIYIFPPSIGFYYMSNIFLSPLLYINWLQLILPSILTLLVSIDLCICQRQQICLCLSLTSYHSFSTQVSTSLNL